PSPTVTGRRRIAFFRSGASGLMPTTACSRSPPLWASNSASEPAVSPRPIDTPARTVVIEAIAPAVDAGRYPIKREVGAELEVTADISKEGHDWRGAFLRYRRADDPSPDSPTRHVDHDRRAGSFAVPAPGRYSAPVAA